MLYSTKNNFDSQYTSFKELNLNKKNYTNEDGEFAEDIWKADKEAWGNVENVIKNYYLNIYTEYYVLVSNRIEDLK